MNLKKFIERIDTAVITNEELLIVMEQQLPIYGINYGQYLNIQMHIAVIAMEQGDIEGTIFEEELHKSFQRDEELAVEIGVTDEQLIKFQTFMINEKLELIDWYSIR